MNALSLLYFFALEFKPVRVGTFNNIDKKTLQRFKDLEHLEADKKATLFDLIDTYIRDAKGRKTYA